MRVLVYMGHPAHFHLYKNVIRRLTEDGNEVDVLIKKKENLEKLLQNSGIPYCNILPEGRKDSTFGMGIGVLKRMWRTFIFVLKHHPNILTGTSVENSYIGPLMRIPVLHCSEDDANAISLQAKVCYPGADEILNPICCNAGKWNRKATKYPSYHELAYLHPNHFIPSYEVVERYGMDTNKSYFILRFVSLNANHDKDIKGINTEIAQRLIDILSPHGQIYITSERELEPQFEPYRIRINPLDMHHVMAFASLYIGDSQTMAAEAGVLGTPFVRFNDFVGRIGYLRELEDVYQLGYGIHATPLSEDSTIRRNDGSLQPNGTQALYDAVETLVAIPAEERRALYAERREKMLSEKIDYAKFLTWFIENYPDSQQQTRENQNNDAFWAQFK